MYDSSKHHRHSIRLPGYDYSKSGIYFVTICIQNRECLLGNIEAGSMSLSLYGEIIRESWLELAKNNKHVSLDEWVIMPNHMHGIIIINNTCHNEADQTRNDVNTGDECKGDAGRGGMCKGDMCKGDSRIAPTLTTPHKPKSLGRLIGSFKTVSTKKINTLQNTQGMIIWQRNYYEHIVRNQHALERIRDYIRQNPYNWQLDKDNPNNF